MNESLGVVRHTWEPSTQMQRQQGPCGFQNGLSTEQFLSQTWLIQWGPVSKRKEGRKETKKQGNIEKKEKKNLKTSTAEIKKTH